MKSLQLWHLMIYSQKRKKHGTPVALKYMHVSTTMGPGFAARWSDHARDLMFSMRRNQGWEVMPRNAWEPHWSLKSHCDRWSPLLFQQNRLLMSPWKGEWLWEHLAHSPLSVNDLKLWRVLSKSVAIRKTTAWFLVATWVATPVFYKPQHQLPSLETPVVLLTCGALQFF